MKVAFVIIYFDFSLNIPSLITAIIAWMIIGILCFRIYKKHGEKLNIWIVITMLLVGLFSFSFNIEMFHTMVKLPIFPLGVWILYFFSRKKKEKWQTYRRFAWLGFIANFIFLAATLAAVPIQHAVYPENELSTYITKLEKPNIIQLHPSAKNVILKKDNLLSQVQLMKPAEIHSDKWYNETVTEDINTENRQERFPYQLTGGVPKWGDNIHTIIYIEHDGKGLLITENHKQYYFRSDQSLLKGVE